MQITLAGQRRVKGEDNKTVTKKILGWNAKIEHCELEAGPLNNVVTNLRMMVCVTLNKCLFCFMVHASLHECLV